MQTTDELRQTRDKPNVLITMSLWPNEEFRRVAKIAFETLTLSRGCSFVLEEEFDPIRDYIKGDVRLPDSRPRELQIDSRFVLRRGDEFRLNFTKQHGVLVLCSPPNFVAFAKQALELSPEAFGISRDLAHKMLRQLNPDTSS